jgi:hypothetical protein
VENAVEENLRDSFPLSGRRKKELDTVSALSPCGFVKQAL